MNSRRFRMTGSRDQGPLNSELTFKLGRLREMLQLDKELDEVSTYFHTVLVPDDEFIMAGTRASNPRLVHVLDGVLSTLAPGGKLSLPLILHIEQDRMWHGYANWAGGHVIFFYFETPEIGFCSFSRSLTSPEVTFSRFTMVGDASRAQWTSARPASA
jgi:hypothetical protein